VVESLIALGSNVGDREANLRRAIDLLGGEMKLNKVSSVYETEPMYYEGQEWFLNCVVSVDIELGPEALLERLKAIEAEVGRRPGVRYGPRIVDLDILFYGDRIVSVPGLEIPHPKIAERAFVLVPLDEIRPALVHPLLKKTVSELARELKSDKRVVRKPGLLADRVSR
jgi:2-amino-4-hydroxy-6-hydroxymethyldihydropteridine diphosphokinase